MDKIFKPFVFIGQRFLAFFGLKVSDSVLGQFYRFFWVGAIATLVDFGLLFCLTEFLNLWYLLSATAGFLGGAVTNYILNKFWTFENKDRRIARQFSIFVFVAIVGLVINNSVLYLMVEFVGLWYMFGKVIATALTFIWNFIGHKYITFRVNR